MRGKNNKLIMGANSATFSLLTEFKVGLNMHYTLNHSSAPGWGWVGFSSTEPAAALLPRQPFFRPTASDHQKNQQ